MAVPLRSRGLLFVAASASVALLSGVVYGWPSLRRLLVRNAVLAEGCETGPDGAPLPCDAQELRFGLIYTLGSYANQFARLPIGIALDRTGPRRTVFCTAVAFAAGALLFAFSSSLGALSVGYTLIGAGGAGVQLALQSTASLFPKRRSLMMASLSCAFQVGSILYLLAEVAEEAFPGSANRLSLFSAHAAVALVVAVGGLFLWQDAPFSPAALLTPSSSSPVGPGATVGVAAAVALGPAKATASRDGTSVGRAEAPATEPRAGVAFPTASAAAAGKPPSQDAVVQRALTSPALHSASFWEQALSPEYLLQLCFFSCNMLPAQFTVGTIGIQLERKGDVDGVHTRAYSAVFAAMALATPIAGYAIDRYGFPPVMAAVNGALCCCYAVLMAPALSVQPVAYVLYSGGRVCLWAIFFSYCAAEFGFRHYGKLAGGGLAFGSLLSLLQYAALAAVVGPLRGDFLAANGIWCALSLSQFGVVWALQRRLRARDREAAPAGAELLPVKGVA